MTDKELDELLAYQMHLVAKNDLNHFRRMVKIACVVFLGMFLFGVAGLFILKVIS